MQVLITTPNLNKMGGVANYYKVLRPYLPAAADYFEMGNRGNESGLAGIRRMRQDYKDYEH